MSAPAHVLEQVFGDNVFAELSLDEVDCLARDVRDMVETEGYTVRDACGELRARIGGARNLKSYCECLVAGEKYRRAFDRADERRGA